MAWFCCDARCRCVPTAVIASAVVGVVTAFLQITGVVTVTPAFLWVVGGVAAVYLGVLLAAAAVTDKGRTCACAASALRALIGGILGTLALAVLLLAIGIVATSVFSAILSGLLLFFFALTVTGAACFVYRLFVCD